MSTLADTLRDARALIDTPEKWTQRTIARDADGRTVPAVSSEAVCFCAEGALVRASNDSGWTTLARVMLRAVLPDDLPVHVWNDARERTHADVLAAFDRAIEAAKATP